MICDVCGHELIVGGWPWCPHDKYGGGIAPDSLPGGGVWVENMGPVPVWVETKSQMHREAAARGLRWTPETAKPGARPIDPDSESRGRHNGGAYPIYRDR